MAGAFQLLRLNPAVTQEKVFDLRSKNLYLAKGLFIEKLRWILRYNI